MKNYNNSQIADNNSTIKNSNNNNQNSNSEINNSSQKEKVTKDFLFDYVYAIVEKTISLNSLS